MPIILAASDPTRSDPDTGAAVTYLRIDTLHLLSTLTKNAASVTLGVYVDGPAALSKSSTRTREIVLTAARAQALADLVKGQIETFLTSAGGPFPTATIVP